MEQGFVDLRLNQQDGQVNESFWPSFTDIMTVIVMIFLIAMVVLLMRNMELVSELRATMEAERVASELARATGEEKQNLSAELLASEERISALQLQLMRFQEKNLAQETSITEQVSKLARLTLERDNLLQEQAQQHMVRERLETDLEAAQVGLARTRQTIVNLEANVTGLEQNLENLQERFEGAQANLSSLQTTVAEQQQALDAARETRLDVDRKHLVLVGEYDDLKIRYDKLVKPARSAQGRRLVEVRYWKANGKYRISYRVDGNGPFHEVSRERLDQRLASLQEAEQNGLYVRVIFPENSGLSYNEAWGFTNHLHQNYDYYFQESEAADSGTQDEQDGAAEDNAANQETKPTTDAE